MGTEEFEDIFNTYNFGLVCYATSIVGEFMAQDFVQEAFIELWQKRNEPHKNIKSFLSTCVRNKCMNHLKSKYNSVSELKFLEDVSDDYIEAQIIRGEYIERIVTEINGLPPGRKKILKLFYGGFYPKEISTILKISESTIGVEIKRFIDGFEKKRKDTSEKFITHDGKTQNMKEWAKELHINYHTLKGRLLRGIPPEIAFKM